MKKLLRSWIESLYEATESWVEPELPSREFYTAGRTSEDVRKEEYIKSCPFRIAMHHVEKYYKIAPRYDGREKDAPDWVQTSYWYVIHKRTGILCEKPYDSQREAERAITDYWEEHYKEWVSKNLHKIEIPNRSW
jgi:hypothetical protein